MSTRRPSCCFHAVSNLYSSPHAGSRLIFIAISNRQTRSFATRNARENGQLERPEKAALLEIRGLRKADPINPPRSTLPPLLKLPQRADVNVALYYFRVGRAYGSFYWLGIKAVWFNNKAAKSLKERVAKDMGSPVKNFRAERVLGLLTRSEFQLLERNSHDIGKLPFFGLMVALFGEWLPLIVPFIPGAVPGTCRIPKQIEGMRKNAEERRRNSFRVAAAEPEAAQLSTDSDVSGKLAWPATKEVHVKKLLGHLRDDQLLHLSSSLNLHSRLWDRLQVAPPSIFLRRGIAKYLTYLACDDWLLVKIPSTPKSLTIDEVHVACEERGIDVLGKHEEALRSCLNSWLEQQKKDEGKGSEMLKMLFRRPNAWGTGNEA